jgi:hypothetical protein
MFNTITQEQEREMEANGNVKLEVDDIGKDVSAERKATPVFSGFMAYFPDAVMEVAKLSQEANEKHNPGEPLHWSKHKSNDHADCLVRHQLEWDTVDPDTGYYHAVAVAWRAMAQLQILLEANKG